MRIHLTILHFIWRFILQAGGCIEVHPFYDRKIMGELYAYGSEVKSTLGPGPIKKE